LVFVTSRRRVTGRTSIRNLTTGCRTFVSGWIPTVKGFGTSFMSGWCREDFVGLAFCQVGPFKAGVVLWSHTRDGLHEIRFHGLMVRLVECLTMGNLENIQWTIVETLNLNICTYFLRIIITTIFMVRTLRSTVAVCRLQLTRSIGSPFGIFVQ